MSGDIEAVVVDDSQFMRTTITNILESDGMSVVATASDGGQAIEAVVENEPDVVTMDIEMPGIDGLEAVERIMNRHPTPILVLSAHTGEDTSVTFEALDRGAVDFFEKPRGEVSVGLSRSGNQLVEAVRSVAAATPPVPDQGEGKRSVRPSAADELPARPTVVVGASTGGPNVVEGLLGGLPPGAFRVLISQHMPESFTGGFADRLDARSEYDVREATDGDRIGGGEVLVAPGDCHMAVSGYRRGRLRVELTDAPDASVRPAIDVTMRSAAEHVDDPLVGAVLTGMGEDGRRGVEAIKRVGGHVVAQDEDTSAVFGMPKRAMETGCVDLVRPAGELAGGIVDVLSSDDGTEMNGTEVSRNP